MDIVPVCDADVLSGIWRRLPSMHLAFFASPNAVDAVMAARPADIGWPDGLWAACVGPGSAGALRRAGVPAARVLAPSTDAPQFDSEALWPMLDALAPWGGKQVMLLRGQGGREWLTDRLRDAGATVVAETVYLRRCPEPDAAQLLQLRDWMDAKPAPLWLLSSSEAVGHWQALVGSLPPLPVLATHPRIAATARAAGLQVTEVRPTVEAVAEAWRRHVERQVRTADRAP